MSKVLTAFIAGIALGILVAPRKGAKTRRKLMDGASDIRDEIKDFVQDASENLKSGLSSAEKQAKDLLQKGRENLEDLGKRFNPRNPAP